MMSRDYAEAVHEKLLNVDEFTLDLLKSLTMSPYQYSEVFMETAFGRGISRIALDPLSYYTYTTTPKDVQEIEEIVASYKGSEKGYREAIHEMVKRHGHNWKNVQVDN